MTENIIYLASPYSHVTEQIMEIRYNQVCKVTANLIKRGYFAYSPIVHFHYIAKLYDLPKDFFFWREFSLAMLDRCDELWVLCLTGWEQSRGVKTEIEYAIKTHKPIKYLKEEECL